MYRSYTKIFRIFLDVSINSYKIAKLLHYSKSENNQNSLFFFLSFTDSLTPRVSDSEQDTAARPAPASKMRRW